MAKQFWDVLEALNQQHKDRWFIVGSYAAWVYLQGDSNESAPLWSTEQWTTVVPGDIDIAISYEGVAKATVNIDESDVGKVQISHVVYNSKIRCGEPKTVTEVEFVYNNMYNNLHAEAFISHGILRLVPLKVLVNRLDMGSAKTEEKNKARLLRAAGLRSVYHLEEKKGGMGKSLFGDLKNFKFNPKN